MLYAKVKENLSKYASYLVILYETTQNLVLFLSKSIPWIENYLSFIRKEKTVPDWKERFKEEHSCDNFVVLILIAKLHISPDLQFQQK